MRGKRAPKRLITADAKYGSPIVAKLINSVMSDGKKSVATQVVYGALEHVQETTKSDPVEILNTAIKNVSPSLEVRSRRVGGANYQVPIPVRGERRLALAFRWLIAGAKAKKARPMSLKLGDELIAASNNEGDAVKKKMDVQRMAEANRAFAHFARF
ncbi:MAG: 30S ribosomal protein S7 [bacterium]|nr:30S ribosomal protein S7 [bacterium]